MLQNPGNHGKGYSVRNGILHSFGEVVMFTDADLSAPIEEADGLFAAIAAGADIAIGSRWLERTRQTIRQPLYRQFFGRCFNAVTRAVMGLPYADTQCGFKAFTRAAAQTVFQLQTIERWGFDPEILFIARKRGYRVVEVPVSWAHDERTRISYLRRRNQNASGHRHRPLECPPRPLQQAGRAHPPRRSRQVGRPAGQEMGRLAKVSVIIPSGRGCPGRVPRSLPLGDRGARPQPCHPERSAFQRSRWTCVCFSFRFSRMTIIKTSTSYFACTAPQQLPRFYRVSGSSPRIDRCLLRSPWFHFQSR